LLASPAANLPDTLAALGMVCQRGRFGLLNFSGHVDGQKVEGTISSVYRTKYYGEIRRRKRVGYRLTVECPCETHGRMVVVHEYTANRLTRWLNRKGGLHPVTSPPPLSHLEAWSHEPRWAEQILQDAECLRMVDSLLPHGNNTPAQSVQWYIDRVGFHASGSLAALARNLPAALRAVTALSTRSRSLPPPRQPHQPGWMETKPWLVVLIVVGGFLGLGLLVPMILLAISYFMSR
jgi:hypothetical protein